MEKAVKLSDNLRNKLIQAGVGRRFWTLSDNNLVEEYRTKVLKLFQELDDSLRKGDGVLVLGEARTGKTTLLSIIAKRILETTRLGVVFIDAFDLLKEFQDNFDRLKQTDVLFIDDLDSVYQTDFNSSLMENLIKYRYKQALSTFYSSKRLSNLGNICGASGIRIIKEVSSLLELEKKAVLD